MQSIERNRGSCFPHGYKLYLASTEEQLVLLGTTHEKDLAKGLGRTTDAVRLQRTRLAIATVIGKQGRKEG